jgi:N-acetyl-1-D-myo-inositol-2-amino-2-deoxy-alpha-D-glucopyranoside deacetylase
VRIMREIRPQVVITFDPYGGYGHPDQIAVHQQTLAVFKAGGDHSRYPEQGEIWQLASLFYDVFPHSLFSNMRLRMEEMDIDVSQFDNSEDLIRAGWPDEEVHVTIDVSSQTQVKRKAFDCNWTQFIAENPLFQLSEPELENILSHEHFVCALPELFPVDRFTDLFWSS